MKSATRVKRAVDRILAGCCVALFALLVVVVVWQVASRQVFQSPATWTEEAARYTFVWLGFAGATLVFSERGHIAADFLVRKLPAAPQRAVGVLVQVLVVVFAAVGLVWGGSRTVVGAWDQNASAIPTDVGKLYVVMPVCGVLIAGYAVGHMVAIARGSEPPTPDVETDIPPDAAPTGDSAAPTRTRED